ncbi:MAG: hypothetical protein II233_01145, partial [Clostridia bacterium]|nr:hypothetical protein [Clostridia bacterium]
IVNTTLILFNQEFKVYKKISTIIANIFLKKEILAEDKYALFKYGCELIISNIVYTLIFLIISREPFI